MINKTLNFNVSSDNLISTHFHMHRSGHAGTLNVTIRGEQKRQNRRECALMTEDLIYHINQSWQTISLVITSSWKHLYNYCLSDEWPSNWLDAPLNSISSFSSVNGNLRTAQRKQFIMG